MTGPWNALFVPVDTPRQNLTLLPSLSTTGVFIKQAACTYQDAACPLPEPTMWTMSSAHETYEWMDGSFWNASTWDNTLDPLRLGGEGKYIHDLITMESEDMGSTLTLINDAVALTSNFTVNFPGGAYYTMDTGFLTLNGVSDNLTWTSTNGSSITLARQIPQAYTQGNIPSISYGLHLGSPSYDVSGSLVLGGYDRSRCFTDPITSSSDYFELSDISIGVSSGDSAFLGLSNGSMTGLLSSSLSSSGQLDIMANPGVPYIYLPQDACDAIAQYLPVTFDSGLQLYLWNTSDAAFANIVSSPHILSFTFESSSSTNNTLHVPFALLNLTLESPIVSKPTQYFPCSPYTPASGKPYHLGRAFLQSAFLAQNWQTNTTWLAQAPGPDIPSEQITRLNQDDTTLSAMINPPSWSSTWSGVLTALETNTTSASNSTSTGTSDTSGTSGSSSSSSSGLSGGAIAGIVIGVVAGLSLVAALAFFLFRRRKQAGQTVLQDPKDFQLVEQQAQQQAQPQQYTELHEDTTHEASSPPLVEAPTPEIHEAGQGKEKVDGKAVWELPGSDYHSPGRGHP